MYKQTENSRFLSCDEEHSCNDPRMLQSFYPVDEHDVPCIIAHPFLSLDLIYNLVKQRVSIDASLVNPDEYYVDILELKRFGDDHLTYIIMGTESAMEKLKDSTHIGKESKVNIIRSYTEDGAWNPVYYLAS